MRFVLEPSARLIQRCLAIARRPENETGRFEILDHVEQASRPLAVLRDIIRGIPN
jgi:hypothetical protein